MWDYHWCSTWVGRAGTLIPRMNRALEAARSLGMTVVHAPTDCVSAFAGTPQRELAAAMPEVPLPAPKDLDVKIDWGLGLGTQCMCGGPYHCTVNYDNSGIDPRLIIAAGDFIVSGPSELFYLCAYRDITHLVYLGGATNMCLIHKPEGMAGMLRLGKTCVLARDLTEAFGPCSGSDDADAHTTFSVDFIERHIGPSIDLVGRLRAVGAWDERWIVDGVMIAPWAFHDRPKFFEDKLRISLSAPRIPDSVIHYTCDGTSPTPTSPRYHSPFNLRESATVHAVAFLKGRAVSRESEASYVRLPPHPPIPDVHLSDLKPVKISMSMWSEWYTEPSSPGPQMDRSLDGSPLVLRGITYERGVGVRAPSQLVYELRPEYGSLVARVGVGEGLLAADCGRGRAQYPRVVFKVFVDGGLAAESPVMRISQEPWRFHVRLPREARVVSLAASSPRRDRPGDLVCWVNAGFVLGGRSG